MIFELTRDLNDAVTAMPRDHPKHRTLELLEEAIRRDIHFIGRLAHDYPQGLFQCLWNSCWWLETGHEDGGAREDGHEPPFALELLAAARLKDTAQPGFRWLRSLRPPENAVGGGQKLALRGRGAPVACSASPARLACTNSFRDIEIWDLSKADLLHVVPFHISHTLVYSTAIALSQDGRFLAQATNFSNELRLVDVESGEIVWRRTGALDRNQIDCLSFKADGRELVCASGHGGVAVVETGGGEVLTRAGGERWHRRFACLPNQTGIACMAQKKRRIVSLEGHVERDLPASEVDLASIAVAPDGSRVATGNVAGDIEIFSLADSECIRKLSGSDTSAAVTALSFTASGDGLVVGREDGVVQSVDSAGVILSTNRFHRTGVEEAVLASTDLVVTASRDSVAAWSAARGTQRNRPGRADHREPVSGIAYSEDGAQIASVSAGELRLWDGETGRELGAWPLQLPAPAERRTGDLFEGIVVRHNRAKRRILVATHADARGGGIRLVVIKLPEASVMLRLGEPPSESDTGNDALRGFDAPDLCDVFITWSRTTLKVWDLEAAEVVREIRHSQDGANINCGAVSSDGRFVATGGDDSVVRVWSVRAGSCEGTFVGHEKPVYLMTWARSGRIVASVSNDGWIRVWDVAHQYEQHRFRHSFELHEEHSAVRAMAMSDDEEYLVSVGKPRMRLTTLETLAKIWDLKKGRLAEEHEARGVRYEGLAESVAREFAVSADECGVFVTRERGGVTVARLPNAFADIAAVRRDGRGLALSSGSNVEIYEIARGAPV